MNVVKKNYNTEMENLIKSFSQNHPKLFLHACCAPCSSACLERVAEFFDITVYFYNPNIHPKTEYFRRRDEILNFVDAFNSKNSSLLKNKINLIEETYNVSDYDSAVRVDLQPELAFEKEKGERCRRCYEFRMKKSFALAENLHFDYFATTLTLSPLKDSDKVNEIGHKLNEEAVASGMHLRYLFTDFKKKNGFLRSLQLSDEYGLYRQTYCGCKYSLANSLREKAEKTKVNSEN